VGLFLFTSQHQTYLALGPLCLSDVIEQADFDPWTGEPHGITWVCDPSRNPDVEGVVVGTPRVIVDDPPIEMAGRTAVPLPIGFLVGATVSIVAFFARGAWRR
jgi:hypothetical protein